MAGVLHFSAAIAADAATAAEVAGAGAVTVEMVEGARSST